MSKNKRRKHRKEPRPRRLDPAIKRLTQVICTRKGCTKLAWATPCVRVWAMEMPFEQSTTKSANIHFADCPTCVLCATDLKLADFCNEAAQKMLTASFAKSNKPLPAWKTARLDWIPLIARVAEPGT